MTLTICFPKANNEQLHWHYSWPKSARCLITPPSFSMTRRHHWITATAGKWQNDSHRWQWSDKSSFSEIMLAWILPTSIGAAGLTLIAGGSPFSVGSALLVAPIAAIHPLLGTGMVVGVVEAWRRKPSVADCERVPEDIQSLRGFWKNPVTRPGVVIGASVGELDTVAIKPNVRLII